MGFGNMKNMMKQAQKMQAEMARVQKELEEKEVEATSGGGAVHVVVSGKLELKQLEIDQDAIDPEDKEILEDMILGAVNEGLRKAQDLASSEMQKVTGGLSLPGM
ncbi:YbaB/EbfC family nucleoid-associated protein [Clostridia bacterium]|nr:YbaB/EbfC family nucleoid-associated protein [Clostridia bacterium]